MYDVETVWQLIGLVYSNLYTFKKLIIRFTFLPTYWFHYVAVVEVGCFTLCHLNICLLWLHLSQSIAKPLPPHTTT